MRITDSARGLFGVLLTVAVAGVAACGSDEATPGGSGGGGDASVTWGDDSCGACVKTTCAAESSECGADPGCAAYLACLFACPSAPTGDPDPACEASCPSPAGGAGATAYGAFGSCRASAASTCTACPQPDAGTPDAPSPDSGSGILGQQCSPSADPDGCVKCEDDNCCETHAACKANPACGEYLTCLQSCTKDFNVCTVECAENVPVEAVELFARRLSCIEVYCTEASQCGGKTACNDCLVANCPDSFVASTGTAESFHYQACLAPCGTEPSCIVACSEQYPEAAQAWADMLTCADAQGCNGPCSL